MAGERKAGSLRGRAEGDESGRLLALARRLPASGTYALVLLMEREKRLRVGALGETDFPEGHYVYVGSARRGLRPRVMRHLAKKKRLRWHVDWLTSLPGCRPFAVMWTSRIGVECGVALLLRRAADGYVPRFGSTDCGCASHLLGFRSARAIERALSGSGLGIQSFRLERRDER